MSGVVLRDAGPDDAAGIAHVHVEGWRSTYRGLFPGAFLDALDEVNRAINWRQWLPAEGGQHTLVAIEDGEVIGFASGGPARGKHGFEGELYAIYLLPDVRRKGIGGRLMARLFNRFQDDGRATAHLWVHDGNVAGEAFYRQLGGVPGLREEHTEPAPHTGVSYAWDRAGIARVAAMDRP